MTPAVAALRAAGFEALAARAALFDAELGAETTPVRPFLLDAEARLAALLAPATADPSADPAAEARALRAAFGGAPEAVRAGIETALVRACAPRAALQTVPAEALFDAEELRGLPAPPDDDRPPAPIDLRQRVGQPIDYRGYLCLILKVTRLCNLRCTYCKDWSADRGTTVSAPFLARLFAQALGVRRAGFDLVLHGGEPLMMGRRRFLQMMWLLNRAARPGQAVRVHMQTNGTLVDERWVRTLSLFGVRASVSLDGPDTLHDLARPDVLARPTAARAARGMETLRAAGLLSGVLIVVTPETVALGAETLLRSLQARGVESVCLLPERPEARAPARLAARDFVGFLVDVARTRARLPGPWIAIREIDGPRQLIDGNPSGFCELAGNCVGHFITVDADGDVSHCDKYVGDDAYSLGNLNDAPLDAILEGARTAAVRRTAASMAVDAASACQHKRLCQGWCPHERYVARNSGETDATCCGLAPLFDVLTEMRGEARGASAPTARFEKVAS